MKRKLLRGLAALLAAALLAGMFTAIPVSARGPDESGVKIDLDAMEITFEDWTLVSVTVTESEEFRVGESRRFYCVPLWATMPEAPILGDVYAGWDLRAMAKSSGPAATKASPACSNRAR